MLFEGLRKFLRSKPYSSEDYDEEAFVDYCLMFYGEKSGAIYQIQASKLEVYSAVRKYEAILTEKGEEIRGDTFDRAAIRDLILESREDRIKERTMSKWTTPNKTQSHPRFLV